MPIMIRETAQRLESTTRKTIAKSITESVHDVIGSDLNLISVVFHELGQDQIWLAGEPSQDVLILCYIRAGRPMALKTQLALRVSAAWHEAVGTPEDAIEVAVKNLERSKYKWRLDLGKYKWQIKSRTA